MAREARARRRSSSSRSSRPFCSCCCSGSSTSGERVPAPCPRGPIATAAPAANAALLYATEPHPPGGVENTPPMNAPGGEYSAIADGGCSAVNPASNNAPLQVTLRFNLVLVTPVISQVTADHIIFTAIAILRTEY